MSAMTKPRSRANGESILDSRIENHHRSMTKPRSRANGEGSIYFEKGRNRWVAALSLPDGRRQRWSDPDRDVVRAKLTRAIADRDEGLPPEGDRTTVEQLLTWWLGHSLRCRPTTLVFYTGAVARHLVPALGRIELRKLTPQHVEQMMGRKRAEVSAARANALRAVLRQALAVAEKRELVRRNVAALVEPYRVPTRGVEPLSLEEGRAFLAQARGDRLYPLYVCALGLGLRQGELLGLTWPDVDLRRGTISVRRQLQRIKLPDASGKLTATLVELKTPASRRTVPIPDGVARVLVDHRRAQLQERSLAHGRSWQDAALVFSTRYGTPLDAANVRRAFDRALARAGLAHRRFHDQRHTTASLLQAVGVHPFVAQQLLGHSRTEMTKRYSHPYEALLVDAAARIDAALLPDDGLVEQR